MNPLYNAMKTTNNGVKNNNIMSLLSDFMYFASNFKGNPNEKINELLTSGNVTREQYDNAVKIAKQVEPFVKNMMKTGHN